MARLVPREAAKAAHEGGQLETAGEGPGYPHAGQGPPRGPGAGSARHVLGVAGSTGHVPWTGPGLH